MGQFTDFIFQKTQALICGFVMPLVLAGSITAVDSASGIKVVSDKNADASSVENIIKDICKPGMSDQEKAEAVFTYVVTHFYHHHTIEEPNADKVENLLVKIRKW